VAYIQVLRFVAVMFVLCLIGAVIIAFQGNPSDVAKSTNAALLHLCEVFGGAFVGLLSGKSL
jgi:hypothetical protein